MRGRNEGADCEAKPGLTEDAVRRDFLRGAALAGAAMVAVAGGLSVPGCCSDAELEKAKADLRVLENKNKELLSLVGKDTAKEIRDLNARISEMEKLGGISASVDSIVRSDGSIAKVVRVEVQSIAGNEKLCAIWGGLAPAEIGGPAGTFVDSDRRIVVTFGGCRNGSGAGPEGNKVNAQCKC